MSSRVPNEDQNSKLIVFVIGGLSHQEISSINSFERNQIIHGKWPRERIILGSTSKDILTGKSMLKMLSEMDQSQAGKPR
jgi:hypothetical protein